MRKSIAETTRGGSTYHSCLFGIMQQQSGAAAGSGHCNFLRAHSHVIDSKSTGQRRRAVVEHRGGCAHGWKDATEKSIMYWEIGLHFPTQPSWVCRIQKYGPKCIPKNIKRVQQAQKGKHQNGMSPNGLSFQTRKSQN